MANLLDRYGHPCNGRIDLETERRLASYARMGEAYIEAKRPMTRDVVLGEANWQAARFRQSAEQVRLLDIAGERQRLDAYDGYTPREELRAKKAALFSEEATLRRQVIENNFASTARVLNIVNYETEAGR